MKAVWNNVKISLGRPFSINIYLTMWHTALHLSTSFHTAVPVCWHTHKIWKSAKFSVWKFVTGFPRYCNNKASYSPWQLIIHTCVYLNRFIPYWFLQLLAVCHQPLRDVANLVPNLVDI
jgi:hypothetical protein